MSRLFHITLIVLVILSVPVVIFQAAATAFMSGVGSGLGLLLAAIYTLLWIIVLRSSAAWPRAGVWWIIASLLWGGGVSFLVVLGTAMPLMTLMDKLEWTFLTASFGGAYPEEIAKALGVAVILLSFRRLTRPWHGFITGGLVGLGFEVFENLLYGAVMAMLHPNSDLVGVLGSWAIRGIAGPGLHVVFTSLAGWGIGLALFAAGKSLWWRWGRAVGWTFLAFAFHFGWNLMWETTLQQFIGMAVVAVLMYPVYVTLYVRSHRAAKRDPDRVVLPAPVHSLAELEAHRRIHGDPLRSGSAVAGGLGTAAAESSGAYSDSSEKY